MGDEAPRPKRKKKKPRSPESGSYREPAPRPPPPPPVATTWAPPWVSLASTVLACCYLLLVYSDASGWMWLGDHLPRPLRYFAQIAALFPEADRAATEYHAEGWVCRDKKWVELDVRPWFPINADDKESRFGRAMQFYKRDRPAMNALDAFVVEHANRDRAAAAATGAGPTEPIGGVRFSRLSIPFPEFGAKVERYAWHPLASAPKGWKFDYYWSKWSARKERCKAFDPDYDDTEARRREEAASEHPSEKPAPADEAEP